MKKLLTMTLLLGLALTASIGLSAKVNTPLLNREGQGGGSAPFTGYLFAYFEGGGDKNLQEQLRFAVSEDAVNWYALNGNRPIIASDSISESGGIRDPHILRGEDGCYYIVATDMMVAKNGWKENPGIVMMKSKDLINWTHGKVNLGKDWPAFSDAYWVWAPQTIYDRRVKKYMIYFTLQRTGDNRQSLITYYAYANADFTAFESEPKKLFAAKYGSIDNDIIVEKREKSGREIYHLFYKGNTKDANGKEYINGIQQATSKNLLGPWKEDFKYLDAYAGTKTHVEGSSVFRTHPQTPPIREGSGLRADKSKQAGGPPSLTGGAGGWVLMYDLYSSGRYEYQTSTDLIHWTKEPQSFRKDFFPRHGSVISVTKEELERVQQKWGWVLTHEFESNGNPIIRDKHTADPAVLVEGDTLWLFAGHDMEGNQKGYVMKDWLLYSTTDMKHWTEHPSPLHIDEFKWASSKQAYAGHVAKGKDGRYYWYVSTNWCGIGVAVADNIKGPYKDALGKPLLTKEDCFASKHSWCVIDPAILIDDDGTPYIIWGNGQCYYAKLKDNMIEIDGDIHQIDVPRFTEAPWVHKYNGKYYLTYASEWPEKIAYAVADHIGGPYTPMGIISEIAGNSNTTHPAIVNFKGQWIFFSHNGGLPDGTSYSRSIIAEPLFYNPDGTIRNIPPTAEGVAQVKESAESDMAGYVMVYHKDADHGLHMAYSWDGYTWTALNDDRPIMAGDTIAVQKGIRDPYIFRNPKNGAFLAAMTDLHVFGQRDGVRTTEWERDGKLYDWGNNRGLVLLRSTDLIHWQRTNLDFSALTCPTGEVDGEGKPISWKDVGCVWAPEMIFDEVRDQVMLYFTTRFFRGRNHIRYAYMNDAFTQMTSEPAFLFSAPRDENGNLKSNMIDADITKIGDTYHLFSTENGHPRHSTSTCLTGPYTTDYSFDDGVPQVHEAPMVWKLIGQQKWILMQDRYSMQPHNFNFCETTDFKTFTPLGYFDEPNCPMKRTNFSEQKHGAVVQVTKQELERLIKHWKKKGK